MEENLNEKILCCCHSTFRGNMQGTVCFDCFQLLPIFLELNYLREESCKYFTINQSIQNPTEREIAQVCSDKSANGRTIP